MTNLLPHAQAANRLPFQCQCYLTYQGPCLFVLKRRCSLSTWWWKPIPKTLVKMDSLPCNKKKTQNRSWHGSPGCTSSPKNIWEAQKNQTQPSMQLLIRLLVGLIRLSFGFRWSFALTFFALAFALLSFFHLDRSLVRARAKQSVSQSVS